MSLLVIGRTVYVATITHGNGTNVYIHATPQGRARAIAEFCRNWWDEWCDGDPPDDDVACYKEYFKSAVGEDLELHEEKIVK